MDRTANPRVKICCISSLEEAWLAVEHGAAALGFVSAMPSGVGIVSEEVIAEIVPRIPPTVSTFLLTSLQDSEAIIQQHRRCRTSTIQICDRLEKGSYREMREAMPGIALVQVIHVGGEESIVEARRIAPAVDAVLLDSGNQALEIKELGGTGRTHDWEISLRIRQALDIPVLLAGGIKPENVRAAVEAVGPFAVDICSGLRTNGNLDREKVHALFHALRNQKNAYA